MPKYFDEEERYVIDEPSLLTISGSVDILYAGGTAHQDGDFTIQIGNIESYNPTSLPSEPAPEITPQQPSGDNEEPSDNPTTPQDSGDDNPTEIIVSNEVEKIYGTNVGNVPINIILNNVSNLDIYITGFLCNCIYNSTIDDWGQIAYIIDPYSKNSAMYYIPANTSVTIPAERLSIYVMGNDLAEDEVPSKYYGGLVLYDDEGPANWRVYSWTKNTAGTLANDPAVIKSIPGTVNFTDGGSVEFKLTGTNPSEGTIVRYANPINLAAL